MTGTNSTSTPKLHLDRFPLDPAASSDRDGDGYPERWNEEYDEQDSITGLKLDLFPDDPGEWRDSDWPMGDGVGDRGDFLPGLHNILFYSIIALTMVLGLILLLIVQRKRQKRLVDWLFSMDVIDADEQINGRLLKDIRLLRDKWTDFKCDNKFKLAHEMNRNELNRTREKINRFNKMAHHGTQASHAAEQVIGKLSEQSDMLSGRGNQLYCLKEKYDMAIHELEDEVRLYILNAKSNQTSADEIRQILERADRRKNDIQRQLAEITSTRPQHVKAETPPQVSSSPHNYPNVQYPRHDTVIPRAQPPQPSEPVESAGEPSSSAGTTTGFRPKYSPDHHTPPTRSPFRFPDQHLHLHLHLHHRHPLRKRNHRYSQPVGRYSARYVLVTSRTGRKLTNASVARYFIPRAGRERENVPSASDPLRVRMWDCPKRMLQPRRSFRKSFL